MLTEARFARAAGILEGEGSFFHPKGYCSPTVSCNMTDSDVIYELQSCFGGTVRDYDAKYEGSKHYWVWTIHGQDAVNVMEIVRSYMFSRRSAKIDEVLKVWYDRQEVVRVEENARTLLAKAYLDGEGTYRAIAEKYGVSRTAVFNAVKKQNIPS